MIGPYRAPRTRLPGAGGAPEIAARCGEVVLIVPHSTRTFVERLDFVTTVGTATAGARERLGFRGRGPTAVITDLGVLEPDPETCELTLTHVHPGVTAEQVWRCHRLRAAHGARRSGHGGADRGRARGAARAHRPLNSQSEHSLALEESALVEATVMEHSTLCPNVATDGLQRTRGT